jgi:O-methyltransferase involved in polyketide biosynthesis
MLKLKVDDLTGVSETLLIPLHYRVVESTSGSGLFKDDVAERFHDMIVYDWEKFQGHQLQRPGIIARTRILDREVGAFIDAHPDGLVVNLGAGLDTRFHRLDNGAITWIEIDLPAVITFRQKLQEPSNPRHVLLAGSVLDDDWIPKVKLLARRCILFVAEGLFPYFTEAQHRAIFALFADHFPGHEMLFQTSALSALQAFAHLSDLSKLRTSADVRWGLEEGADVSSLNPKARFVDEYSLREGHEDSLPEAIRHRLAPDMIKKVARIVRVRFE